MGELAEAHAATHDGCEHVAGAHDRHGVERVEASERHVDAVEPEDLLARGIEFEPHLLLTFREL